ncbi:hypothetical protein SKAU_G00115610 [Synaphobranchus kaupii]|uniref:Uncharacterized protein n=1 Tax=Synaphobranchus kaupii TaxID=118154 RepID=A0A9Q1FN44_SYNKA|nr:hypothetical protein SKAU_G00115610 [Synaphobranchus kaupii]
MLKFNLLKDHILTGFKLYRGLRVHAFSIRAVHYSDHHMVTVSLVWEKAITIGRGLWRMNTSHLQDPKVCLSFSRRYLEWLLKTEGYTKGKMCPVLISAQTSDSCYMQI